MGGNGIPSGRTWISVEVGNRRRIAACVGSGVVGCALREPGTRRKPDPTANDGARSGAGVYTAGLIERRGAGRMEARFATISKFPYGQANFCYSCTLC